MNVWGMLATAIVTLALAEYYRRLIDAIRREQIAELKEQIRSQRPRVHATRKDMISPQQYQEYREHGRTAGMRLQGMDIEM